MTFSRFTYFRIKLQLKTISWSAIFYFVVLNDTFYYKINININKYKIKKKYEGLGTDYIDIIKL